MVEKVQYQKKLMLKELTDLETIKKIDKKENVERI